MTQKRPLTLDELEGFFTNKNHPKYLHEIKYRALLGLMFLLGCRVGEVLSNRPEIKKNKKHVGYGPKLHGLRWKDINLDGKEFGYISIHLRTEKNKKKPYRDILVPIKWGVAPAGFGENRWKRLVQIEQSCLAALNQWSEIQEKFHARKPNNEVFPVGFECTKAKISNLMGFDDDGISLTSHYFRHTRTSYDDERGLSLSENQSQRGHAKAATTSIYLHPNKESIVRKLIGG